MTKPPRFEQIAIDGPAASGKSTVAKRLADMLGGNYVNTGEMYRTVAWLCLQRGLDPARDADAIVAMLKTVELSHILVDGRLVLQLDGQPVPGPQLREAAVANLSSTVSAISGVRAWLLDRQRDAAKVGLIVMEGRDIGTVIFPHARHKFFMTASPRERARRRLAQAGEVVEGATLDSVERDIAERDERDSTRPISPLKPAMDAVIVDSTGLSIDEVVSRVAEIIRSRWTS